MAHTKKRKKEMVKRVYRAAEKDSMIGGVCGGLATYWNVDPTLIRLLSVVLAFISLGAALLAYIAAWVIMPRK